MSKSPSDCNFFGPLLVWWGVPQSPDCWSSCNVPRKMGVWGMEGDSGIVIEDVCENGMGNLGDWHRYS